MDDLEFFQRFRLKKLTCRRLLGEIKHNIQSRTIQNKAISPAIKLLLTLRFFATGSMLIVVGDFAGVSKATACVCVKQVSEAIAMLRPTYIKMPITTEERQLVIENFYKIARFPCVLGAIDCTHIKLQSPGGENAEHFRNRKGYFSWNVQVVCDANLCIRDIVVRWPGSSHDSHIFNSSSIKTKFESGDMGNSVLLGDSGYANTNYLLTPLLEVTTPAQNLYNESQIRTRNTIERCFGVWKRRFPILSLGMRVSLSKSQTIVVATAILHNIAIQEKNDLGMNEEDYAFDHNENDEVPHENNLINNIRRNNIIVNHFENLLRNAN